MKSRKPTAADEAQATQDHSSPQHQHPDTVRLNWLEHMARTGGLFLYNGVDAKRERATAVGLGLRPGTMDRTLREAIDAAAPSSGWNLKETP